MCIDVYKIKMAAVRAVAVGRSSRKFVIGNLVAISQRNLSGKLDNNEDDVQITHTGQKFENGDYRLVRFIDKPKQINERFAIDLINEVPPQAVNDRSVWCDGGGGPLGHPRVFINLDKPGNQTCGYCGLRFHQQHQH